ncbi:MAG: archease [Thermoleophilia bacterium]
MKPFETIEHSADIGIRAYGSTREEAFENAAVGMFSLIGDLGSVNPVDEYSITVEADDIETLLVEWLNELLYLYDSSSVLLSRFTVQELGETLMRGTAFGETLDSARHHPETDIKAVTYHMLRLRRLNGAWSAEVVFDI